MITLIAKLCGLCAVCSALQTALGERDRAGFRMIGGLLMLHLVLFGLSDLLEQALKEPDLMRLFKILIR